MSPRRVLVWTFTLICFVEIGAVPMVALVWGFGWFGAPAMALLVILAFSALRWRDDLMIEEGFHRAAEADDDEEGWS